MTFLNPALFWGLIALAAPLIVHFLNLQRPRTVLFSNVAFVREIKKTVVRRVQIRQWLILLFRLLAIAALVLAFAHPVRTGSGADQAGQRRSVVIAVDNSFSMEAGNERGPYFQQALSIARNIVKSYDREDEFLISGWSRLPLQGAFARGEDALESMRSLAPEQTTRPMADWLARAPDLFARANFQAREFYLISDFQRSTVLSDSAPPAWRDSSGIQLRLLPLANRPQRNVYISGLKVESRILEQGKPLSLSLRVVNDGDSETDELALRVNLGGKMAAISTLRLAPGETRDASLLLTPDASGWLSGYAEVDDIALDFDNRRYFSLLIPQKSRVLLVEQQPSRPLRLLYELFSQFETQRIAGRALAGESLDPYRAIVLAGVPPLSSGLREKIREFVSKGGSLMVFPGESADLASLNALFQELGAGSWGEKRMAPEGLAASQADLGHPVFEGVFAGKSSSASFDGPTLFQYYPFSPQGSARRQDILSLESGEPVLTEIQPESGLIYAFSFFPDQAWTDLPVKTLFSPLMLRLTQMMCQARASSPAQEIGRFEPITLQTQSAAPFRLRDDEGREFSPDQFPRGGAVTLQFERMNLGAGNYDLLQGDSLVQKISFNVGDAESKLACLSQQEVEEYAGTRSLPALVLSPNADLLARRIETERSGSSLWPWLVAAALLCFAVEIFLLQWKS